MKHPLRSAQSTEGRRMAGARALWVANGMKREQIGKPIIAIVNSFTQFVPAHVHLHQIGQEIKQEIKQEQKYIQPKDVKISKNMDLSKRTGLSKEDLDTLKIGGLFHDIGKIGISDAILLKNGKLNSIHLVLSSNILVLSLVVPFHLSKMKEHMVKLLKMLLLLLKNADLKTNATFQE